MTKDEYIELEPFIKQFGGFNADHPERKVDEMWLTNCLQNEVTLFEYETKRMGYLAYTYGGTLIRDYFDENSSIPIFVKISEVDPDSIISKLWK